MAEQGLRERKKWQTRRRISDVATGLFLKHGFDEVTVAQVAEAADVSKMTVFNYFSCKEDLILDRPAEQQARIVGLLSERPADQSYVDALRAYHHELLSSGHPLSGVLEGADRFYEVIDQAPRLRARVVRQQDELVTAIADVITADGVDPLRAKTFAALLVSCSRVVVDEARGRLAAGWTVEDVRAAQSTVIDATFDVVADGLGSAGVRSAADAP